MQLSQALRLLEALLHYRSSLHFSNMNLDSPIVEVPLIGPSYAKRLKKLGIETAQDLIYHFPHRYEDFSLVSDMALAQPGEIVTIRGQITSIKNIYTRTGKKIQSATVSDGKNVISATWFNQPFLVRTLPIGTYVSLSGKISWFGRQRSLVAPEYEKMGSASSTIHTGRLVPIYPETYGISSKWLRSRIARVLPQVLPEIEEFLPDTILKKNNLISLRDALQQIHFPENLEEDKKARRRLAFDEFFQIQLRSLSRKQDWKEKKLAHRLAVNQEKVMGFINNLPFTLTLAQKRAMREILEDIAKNQPMNRLLEGDVGSGKTVVAALACFVAYTNGFQSVIMAPTQILASQHFKTLTTILAPFDVKVGLRVSGSSIVHRPSSTFDVVVGTHALLQKGINFENLALVVIDEQQRFGVAQRALLARKQSLSLRDKSGNITPHVLTMTATPIPRTVALTIYGDLDLSILDEMPTGRISIKTWVVPPQKREAAYEWIKKQVKNTDEQAFIVCPIIEESDKETMKSVRAATVEFERLQKKVFPDLKLGLLHGRVKTKEKEEIMNNMKGGKLDILVATPVVEVGIDIPNATIMMIEGAERFGLAQLHQLRGRVGRSNKQSYCLLFTDIRSPRVLSRLKALERTQSGARLAELDLRMRGPGEVYGTLQHGFPELKVGSFSDVELIKAAREGAEELVDKIKNYPNLEKLLKEKDSIAPN